MIPCSGRRVPSSSRCQPNRQRSIVWYWPANNSSAMARPQAFEVVLEPAERLDRNLDIDHGANVLGPRASGVDKLVGVDLPAGAELRFGYAAPVADEHDDLVGQELRTHRLGLVAESHQHAVRVQPTILGRVHGGAKVRDGRMHAGSTPA